MLRGESNVAIVPAIGGDVVEDICLGEFFTLAQAEYSGLLTEPEAYVGNATAGVTRLVQRLCYDPIVTYTESSSQVLVGTRG